MAKLREVCEATGATNVRTHIASGNVLLESSLTKSQLRPRLERDLEDQFGFAIPVVFLSASELRAVVKKNPFPRADPRSIHVAFSTGPIEAATKSRLESLEAGEERAILVGRLIYLYLPHGFGGGTSVGPGMSKIKPPVTIRGWPTVLKLNEMLTIAR